MDIRADMIPVKSKNGNDTLQAVGSVLIDNLIRIENVKFLNFTQKDGTTRPAICLPNRKIEKKDGSIEWVPVLNVSTEVKKQIDEAVVKDLNEKLQSDFDDHRIEVTVTPYQNSGSDFLGYATVKYENAVTIKDIRIYRNKNNDGDDIWLAYPNDAMSKTSLVKIESILLPAAITREVQRAYEQAISAPEKQKGESI